jgi:type II secretory pathway component PulL
MDVDRNHPATHRLFPEDQKPESLLKYSEQHATKQYPESGESYLSSETQFL